MSDALLAVVVEAREDLGVAEMFLTNGAGDLLIQLFQSLLHGIRSFRHRNCSLLRKTETEQWVKMAELRYAHIAVVRMCKIPTRV